jgi:hypothetical protein
VTFFPSTHSSIFRIGWKEFADALNATGEVALAVGLQM